MTIAPPRTSSSLETPAPAGPPSVSAVLVVRHGEPWLPETLEALARQNRRRRTASWSSTPGRRDRLDLAVRGRGAWAGRVPRSPCCGPTAATTFGAASPWPWPGSTPTA